MTEFILGIFAIPVLVILVVFNFRRLLFTFTILFIGRESVRENKANNEELPGILLLAACRDEAEMIPGLARSLRQLDYPREKLQVVLIDDGSTDGTTIAMQEQVQQNPAWNMLRLHQNIGKASALNAALARFSTSELIFIFDVDHRPDPQVLKRAARYFRDPQVAAVTGFTKVKNPVASPSAYYSTIESYINQLVTMRAKDRLGLAPALLGSNCAYRRKPLTECGGFRTGAFSEDSDLTVTFYNAGYRIRFAEDMLSLQQVPQTIRGYLKQHIRWGRGLNDVARIHSLEILRNPSLSLPLRLELLLFTSGYLDRLALMGTGILALYAYLSRGVFELFFSIFVFALLTPFIQITGLFIKERMSLSMWIRLPFVPIFFALDILAAMWAMLDTLLNRSRSWSRTERAESH